MYSLLSTFLALVLLVLVGILVFMLRKKINSLISWLQILFCVSFFSCATLILYYTQYYLGESQVLQKVYFGLFYLSIILLFLIIGLRFLQYYSKKKSV